MNYHFLLFIYLLAILANCSGSKKISVVSENSSLEKAKSERSVFLKEATFYGLQKDNFPVEIANSLVEEKSIWVVKCPICDNVKRGFKMYTSIDTDQENSKIAAAVLDQLSGDDLTVKKRGLRDLMDRYVQQYYSVLKMTKPEKQVMQIQLEEGRKAGMNAANGGEGFFCASCDGACHKTD